MKMDHPLPLSLGLAALILLAGVPVQAATFNVTANPNNTFAPSTLSIEVGDSVTWTNAGGIHNVRAVDGSFRCAQGCDGAGGNGSASSNAWSFTLTFNSPGTVDYDCQVHGGAGMTGRIIVVDGGGGGGGGLPGSVRFSQSGYTAGEGAGNATLTIQRVDGDDGAASVDVMTSDGTATAGLDYGAKSQTINWPAGNDDPRSFTIPILEDTADEANETVLITLANPTGVTLGTPAAATLTINDNDAAPMPSDCVSSETVLCLTGGRFQVTLDFRLTLADPVTPAPALTFGSDSSGIFYFRNPNNAEMLVKVLDGCPINSRYWVFYAATTNVEFTLTVVDTDNGTTRTYPNPRGMAAAPIQDTSAFATCP